MYLVTGGSGFIGSNFCHHLGGQEEIVVVDALLEGSDITNLEGANVIFKKVDIRDSQALEAVFKRYNITHIIHLAAMSHVDRSIAGDKVFWEINVLGTRNVMELASKYKVKVIINQITDEAYGPISVGEAFEGDKFNPTSPYPCSKVAQYWVGRSYATTYGLPVISTFPVNNYGPRQHLEKLIPSFTTKLLKGKKVPLMTSSHFQRDWLSVEDMVQALYLLATKGVPGEDYNVGVNKHYSNREVTDKLLKLCKRDESFIEMVPDRKAHDSRYAVNSTKIESLGFRANFDFKSHLKHTVKWYKEKLWTSNLITSVGLLTI